MCCVFHLILFLILSIIGCRCWPAGPSFIDTITQNITVNEGSQAFLPCTVANLGDKSVTWLRRRNLHIITAGLLTYSPDDRYRVLHGANTQEWTLHIKSTQLHDAGWYQCQVNSHPKITRPILLIVKDKRFNDPFYKMELEIPQNGTSVTIFGGSEKYIQEGSVLRITCLINHTNQRGPVNIAWYHGATRVYYDNPRGGIAIKIDKTYDRTISRLMLSDVTYKDSGHYTCHPDTGGTAAITLHVQSGQQQQQAAVQISSHPTSKPCAVQFIILCFSIQFIT